MITHKIAICEMGLPRSYSELISGGPISDINYRAQITNSSSSNYNLKLTVMSKIPPEFHNSTFIMCSPPTCLHTSLPTYLSTTSVNTVPACRLVQWTHVLWQKLLFPEAEAADVIKTEIGFLNKAKLGNRVSVCHINVSPALSLLCL